MNVIAVGFVTGVLGSLVASGLFLRFMLSLRPRIEISPQIGRMQGETRTYYIIKFINKTAVDLINVQMEFRRLIRHKVEGGYVNDTVGIALKRSNIMVLYKFDHNDKEVQYAFRALTYEDLHAACGPDCKLDFRIYAAHSVSGFGKVFHWQYKSSDIIDGDFLFGNTLEIIPKPYQGSSPATPPLPSHTPP